MSGGSGNFTGVPWLLIRRGCGRRDRRAIAVEQLAQARASALCDLAVFLSRPAMAATERRAATPRDLMYQDKLLICAELARSGDDATQLAAHQHERLDIRTAVNEHHVARLARRDRQRGRQGRADRTPTRERATQVSDPRHHSQLQCVGDMRVARERVSAPDLSEQLERRLRMTVLEILTPQHPPVGPQEYLALGLCDARDRVLLADREVCARIAGASLAATSSRHTWMSTRAAHIPPREFRGDQPSARSGAARGAGR